MIAWMCRIAVVAGVWVSASPGLALGMPTALPTPRVEQVSQQESAEERVCRLKDRRLAESSGLVVVGDRLVTTNDSGSAGSLFILNQQCKTTRVVRWAAKPKDVEALAPAGGTAVWVGDIGDNAKKRDQIVLTKVRLSDGKVLARRELRYPERAQDAESLLAQPGTGQLFVATKAAMGGKLYRVPAKGRQLVAVGSVVSLATDGAFLNDRRLVIRNYASAVVYELKPWRVVARVSLPSQSQGEAIAATKGGAWWLTSEGVGSTVWRVTPDLVEAAVADKADSSTDDPSPSESASAGGTDPDGDSTEASAADQKRAVNQSTAGGFGSPLGWLAGLVALVAGTFAFLALTVQWYANRARS